MTKSPAHYSDQTLRAARASIADQRAGGRRNSIGRRSAALKRQHALRQVKRAAMTVIGILFAAMAVGVVIDGIGWGGIIVTLLAIFAAITAFAVVPKVKVPTRDSLTKGDVRSLVGRTELWLESQRPALPAPAVQLVDHIGLQLDALGQQLDGSTPIHRPRATCGNWWARRCPAWSPPIPPSRATCGQRPMRAPVPTSN